MGGATRYPLIAVCEDDGFSKGSTHPTRCCAEENLGTQPTSNLRSLPSWAGLSHMEFSMRSTHEPCLFRVTFFNESSLRTQGPIRRGISFWRWSRGLFYF